MKGAHFSILILFGIIFFLGDGVLLTALAGDVAKAPYLEQKRKLKHISREIQEKEEKLRAIEKKRKLVLDKMAELNQEIKHHWDLLRQKKKDCAQKGLEIARTQEAINGLRKALKKKRGLIQKRLRIIWEFGPLGALNVLLSAHSIPDLLSRQQYLYFILDEDQRSLKRYLRDIQELKAHKDTLVRQKKALATLTSDMEMEALALEEARETKQAFLKDLEAQKEGYASMITSLREAEKGLTQVIQRFGSGSKASSKAHHPGRYALSFRANMGHLTPPILESIRILTPKGQPMVPKNGIVLEAPLGTPVLAIFDGVVKYTGRIKGFGTIVIIDHGDGFMSLSGYLSRAFVQPGKDVLEGETIGIAGPGGFVGSGVYLEIRKNGIPIDPLTCIDTRGMKIQ